MRNRAMWVGGTAAMGMVIGGLWAAAPDPGTRPGTGAGTAANSDAAAEMAVQFSRDIQPILSDNCYACHGPDAKHREADLRLDTREGLFEDKGGYKIVVPGNIEDSELYYRLIVDDEADLMPPPKSGKTLTARQKDLIKKWIEQGAEWQGHWSFIPAQRPALPKVSDPQWPTNEIDRFVLAKLDARGLKPSGEADKRTLVRRVTLDLTGLPPTPEQVAAFVADTSPDAYEKLVDHLLASPRFGEHFGRFWLDAARYGDTHGLHLDNYREIWPYRDWVIDAYNRNLPYNQFVVEQLAGDLMPDATIEQIVATGFNRAHVTTNEGGSIVEEVHIRNVVDRVVTTGTVFMALTFDCTRCHDHKFDPLTMKDFYSMSAFFNSIDGSDMDDNRPDPAPVVRVPTAEQKQQIAQLRRQLAEAEAAIRKKVAAVTFVEPEQPSPAQLPQPKEVVWIDDDVPGKAKAEGGWQFVTKDKGPVFSGEKASTRTAEGLSQHYFEGAADPLPVAEGDKLFAYVYLDEMNPPKQIMLQWNSGQWQHRAYWGGNLIPWGDDNTTSRRRIGDLPEAGKWVRLEVDAAQVGLNAGAKINGWAFTQFDGTVYWDKAGIVTSADPNATFDSLNQWVAYQRAINGPKLPQDIKALLPVEPLQRTAEQHARLTEYFVEHAYAPVRDEFKAMHEQLRKLGEQVGQVEKSFPTTMVFKEAAQPRDAFILKRGEYDQRGEKVQRATPAALPPMPDDLPRNRLGLARWLTDGKHPLTARVAVNRYWQHLFGTGIVKTSEDFGAQGEPPSHPQLLDWLAVEFVDSGWDTKRMIKRMVMSSTYRQSSNVTPQHLEKDPANRLLARGPRFRLDAEMLRDQALSVSGLLVDKMGGPSVKPPQPPGLWEAVGYVGSNTARFSADKGSEKVHRRSVYTFWKRTAAPPQMSTFDAPSRESCIIRRERTNTPLQALLLMNDPQYVEAARALAERAIREGGATEQSRASHLFTLAVGRPPAEADLVDMLAAHRDHLSEYQANLEEAKKLIAIGETKPDEKLDPAELAAWTMTANLVLNLDEVVVKD